jgi:hypothetical protein
MAKFNPKTARVPEEKTTNYMGAEAYNLNPKFELVTTVLTSFMQDKYYESASKEVERIIPLIKADPLFAAKLAIYTRNEFGMRSITHFIAGEIAREKGNWKRGFYDKVVRRVDDMLEIMAYHLNKNGKPIPNGMKRGFADAINRFDAYQLAKYRGEGKAVKLVDLVNLIHPVSRHAETVKVSRDKYLKAVSPKQLEQLTDIDKLPDPIEINPITALVLGLLKNVDTWESKLTKAGQEGKTEQEVTEKKSEAWADLVKEKKLGYFAALRNIRNVIEQAPEVLDDVLNIITNTKMLEKSLVLPFRFLSAYDEVSKISVIETPEAHFESEVAARGAKEDTVAKVKNAIEVALNHSVHNLPKLEGKTLILCDNSGSMRGDGGGLSAVSANSKVTTANIGNLFAVLYWMKCNDTLVGLFGDRLIHPKLDRTKGVFDNYPTIEKSARTVGGSTETGIFTMFRRMLKEKMHVDTCVVFSDNQIGEGCSWYTIERETGFPTLYAKYVKEVNPNLRTYSIDLRGYGTSVFDKNVIRLAGWSEKIFDIMKVMEQDKQALIKKIESIKL